MNRMSRRRRNRWDIPEADVREEQGKTGIRVDLSMSARMEGIPITLEGATSIIPGLSDKSRARGLSFMSHRGEGPLSRILVSIPTRCRDLQACRIMSGSVMAGGMGTQ
jgi:hypothetical protein